MPTRHRKQNKHPLQSHIPYVQDCAPIYNHNRKGNIRTYEISNFQHILTKKKDETTLINKRREQKAAKVSLMTILCMTLGASSNADTLQPPCGKRIGNGAKGMFVNTRACLKVHQIYQTLASHQTCEKEDFISPLPNKALFPQSIASSILVRRLTL